MNESESRIDETRSVVQIPLTRFIYSYYSKNPVLTRSPSKTKEIRESVVPVVEPV